jgi:hypothetical protein
LANAEPSREQLVNLIWNGAQTFDTYYPGFLKILIDDYSAEDAVAICTQEED